MRKNPKRPIIFLPGLMGSMGREMISGTGDWSFGVARWIYQPLIDGLVKRGYTLNEDLFVCHYDWRKGSHEIIDRYLKPTLRKVKERCPDQPIDLISHSRGGIVARSYIQSPGYQDDIGNLVMIGTPNGGSVEAYYCWSTGRLLSETNRKGDLWGMIRKGYMWMLKKLLKIPWGIENIDAIHRSLPVIEELLPALDYGETLCYKSRFGDVRPVPRPWIRYHNFQLDEMNRAIDLRYLRNRVEAVYVIVGNNIKTTECLLVDESKLIHEGKEVIVGHTVTYEGDGTVTANSAQLASFETYEIQKNHHQIVAGSLEILEEIYELEAIQDVDQAQDEDQETLHFIFHCQHKLVIEKDGRQLLSYRNKEVNTQYEFICQEFAQQYVWIILRNIQRGIYTGEMITTDTDLEKLDFTIIGKGVEEELRRREVLRQDQTSVAITFTFEVSG